MNLKKHLLLGSQELIFIVGNSRSGTTMVANILGNHSKIYSFNELHYFDDIWIPTFENKLVDRDIAIEIVSKLLHRQRLEFRIKINKSTFYRESEKIVNEIPRKDLHPAKIYYHFLMSEVKRNKKSIPCKQTPRYIYYTDYLLEHYAECKFIYLIRDPRAVINSQKYRWKRKNIGNEGISKKEVKRLKYNYHPIIFSIMWRRNITFAEKYIESKYFTFLKYEELVTNPKSVIRELCNFLGIKYDRRMLNIKHSSSSFVKTTDDNLGISKNSVNRWEKKGLSIEEIYICQKINISKMKDYGYYPIDVKGIDYCKILIITLSLPFTVGMALLLNFDRYQNKLLSLFKKKKRKK